MMDEEDMMGYGDEEDEENSFGFDNDPQYADFPALDPRRKVRREIMKTINEMRDKFDRPNVHMDLLTNAAAENYAEFLLREEESDQALNTICNENGLVGDHQCVVGHAYLDDSDPVTDKVMMNELMDAHGLLLELQAEREKLCHAELTHLGIGFAANGEKCIVVELLSQRACAIHRLMPNEDEGVRINGSMLSKTVGLYAARIVGASKMDKALGKGVVGPPQMQLNKDTMEFIIEIPGPIEDLWHNKEDPRYVEIYVRKTGNVSGIKYGVADAERIKVDSLSLVHRQKLDIYPDPRTEIEDAKDREDYEVEKAQAAARREQERQAKDAEDMVRREAKKKAMEALENRGGGMDFDSEGMSGDDGAGSQGGSGSGSEGQSASKGSKL